MIQNDPKWLCILCILCTAMHCYALLCTAMHCYALLCTGTSPSFTHRYSASPSPRQSPGSLGPGWLERCSAPKPAEQRCQGATVLLDEQTSTCPWKSFLGPFLDLGRILIIVILSLLSLAPAAQMKPFWAPLFSDDQLTSADQCWPVLTADTQRVLQSTL